MRSADVFAQGYAIAMYDIAADEVIWRYNDEVFTLPCAALYPEDIPNTNFKGAQIERLRDAVRKHAEVE